MKSVMVFKQQATRRKWHLVRLIVVVLLIIGMYIVVTPKMPKFSNHLEIHFQQFISLPDRLSERVNAFNINKKPLLNRDRMYVNMTSKHGLSNKQMGFLSHCMKETRTKLLRNISSVLYDQQNEEFQAHVRVHCSSEHECKHTVLCKFLAFQFRFTVNFQYGLLPISNLFSSMLYYEPGNLKQCVIVLIII